MKGLSSDTDRRALSALLKSSALINSSLQISDVLDSAMKVAEEFGIKQLYVAAATPVRGYVKVPKIYGVATRPELIKMLERRDVAIMDEGAISGFNGLVLSYAKKKDLQAL